MDLRRVAVRIHKMIHVGRLVQYVTNSASSLLGRLLLFFPSGIVRFSYSKWDIMRRVNYRNRFVFQELVVALLRKKESCFVLTIEG